MTKEKFKSLMQEAGIKSKKELAELMGLHYGTINNWGNTQGYPTYLNNYFHFIIKAKKYDEALSGRNLGLVRDEVGCDEPLKVKQELEKLRLENAKLREELEKFERYKEALRAIL
ncbi:hypothetical protein Q6T38_001442 [Campylobacter upsaliensis]|uniref:Uncharacterized protein n=1 Tax=Campylobacter vulpis TaxID=1655500 RepID=A0ABS5P5F3_9BACT|nr:MULTISPECIES: hypothetical protein [Campylobacter]EAH6260016.1 hypothetical protein [Campylobacter upsaliensis]EAH7984244.1 hypothetical protein [Campylobacter upsaliensis]EAH8208788.1 hypothetical protein [Campylobacter upsaliensis]EAH9136660.1 hypothetical protein [Campylobacter upsaliensis]EAH9148720.1 hypothetical protein [Campylobacter upsaliensis]